MLISNPLEHGDPYAVIALNYTLPKYLESVWKQANIRVCVDGGSNRVYDFFKKNGTKDYLSPDAIIGDLKSIRPEVREEFESTGTQIVHIPNNSITDSEKALNLLSDMKVNFPILVLGAYGGKFDETASLINASLARPELRIFLADDSNFSNWVFPGKTKILTPQKVTTNVCGLLPLQKPVSLVTQGLKWNLNGETLKMGEFISSSNELAANEIFIDAKDPIFWTIQAKKVFEITKKKLNNK